MNIRFTSVFLIILLTGFGVYHYHDRDTEAALVQGTTPRNSLTSGLVGYWTFDGPDMLQNVADVSGQGNHGQLVGQSSTTTAPGKLGQALEFDGVDDEVVLDNLTDFDFSQEDAFTIALWVYPGVNSTSDTIISRGNANASAENEVYYLRRYQSGARWQALISDGTNNVQIFATTDGTLDVDEWQYMVLTWNGTTLTLYKNGVSLDTAENGSFTGLWDGSAASIRETSIGADGKAESNYWDGKIDDVRIYNRALSASEVADLYNMGAARMAKTPKDRLTSGLVGYWTFDGPDMLTNVADVSGQGNHGQLENFTATTTAPGKLGQALSLDGTDDYVSVTSFSDITGYPFTLAAWIYPMEEGGTISSALTLGKIGTDDRYFSIGWIHKNSNGTDRVALVGSNTTFDKHESNDPYPFNEWIHVVGIFKSATERELYINGTYDSEDTSSVPELTDADTVSVGTQGNQAYKFGGKIDDARMYDRALSATEITTLYNLGR